MLSSLGTYFGTPHSSTSGLFGIHPSVFVGDLCDFSVSLVLSLEKMLSILCAKLCFSFGCGCGASTMYVWTPGVSASWSWWRPSTCEVQMEADLDSLLMGSSVEEVDVLSPDVVEHTEWVSVAFIEEDIDCVMMSNLAEGQILMWPGTVPNVASEIVPNLSSETSSNVASDTTPNVIRVILSGLEI